VRAGSEIVTIPQMVIDEIKGRVGPDNVLPPPIVTAGASYEITRGSFAGLLFRCEQVEAKRAEAG
jgi:hypothetical protein